MAKRIKALKCPQCGSVKKQSVKEDHYICNNCGTEYFLDNDDINVNVRHHYDKSEQRQVPPLGKQMKVLALVVAGFLLLIAVANLWNTGNGTSNVRNEENYRERISDYLAYTTKSNGQLVLLLFVERTSATSQGAKEEAMLRFYDPINNKILRDQPLDKSWDLNSVRYRRFGDGHIYVCPEKVNQVFRVDQVAHKLDAVDQEFFGKRVEFAAGMATLNFVSERLGDGFEIMTNNGREYYYYPFRDMLYTTYNAVNDAATQIDSLKADAVETSFFIFSERSDRYKEEPIQLLKYWYRHNMGYPTGGPYAARWQDVTIYGKPGSFSNREEKRLFSDGKVTRFVDLTPDRLYFMPEIVYQDSANLLIKGLPNANPEGKAFIQRIDTQTGAVQWSFTADAEKYAYHKQTYPYQQGAVISFYNYGAPGRVNEIVVLDAKGKILKTIDRDNFIVNH